MNKQILLNTAAVMLLGGAVVSAQAAETTTNTNIKARGDTAVYVDRPAHTEEVTKQDVERGLKKVGNSIERAADKVAKAAKDVVDDEPMVIGQANIAVDASADKMIGKPVMNAGGEHVGSVHDVIFAQNGQAKFLIVADGGTMSLGDKKAAFDYSAINGRDANGAVLTSITEAQIDNAMAFSYDANGDANTQVMAANETSAREVIGAKVTDPQDNTVASVEDVSIENGNAAKLIVAYDQFLGLGGKKASLPYDQVSMADNKAGKPNFRLNARQASALNAYTN